MVRMPSLFVGHGSPMNALEKNAVTESFKELGQTLPRPEAILSISAHWQTQGTAVLNHPQPPTIHDFFGFPQSLFDMQYPAVGAPKKAAVTHQLVPGSTLVENWGLDHGTWSVLAHMYPKADIPVYQLSLDTNKNPEEHMKVGKQLRALRDQGVLIFGSGNIVHNLRLIQWRNPDGAFPWAVEFDEYIKKALNERNEKALTQYLNLGEAAKLSVPTDEHFLPLLYVFGASEESDHLSYPFEGYQMGSLSMRTVLFS